MKLKKGKQVAEVENEIHIAAYKAKGWEIVEPKAKAKAKAEPKPEADGQ